MVWCGVTCGGGGGVVPEMGFSFRIKGRQTHSHENSSATWWRSGGFDLLRQ